MENIHDNKISGIGNAVCETVLPVVPLQPLKEIERSIQKKYRNELWSPFIRALKEFELVEEGDRIAIAISGGKDSLLLSKLFQELRRASKTNFELVFISMNPGFNDINLQNLKKIWIIWKFHAKFTMTIFLKLLNRLQRIIHATCVPK